MTEQEEHILQQLISLCGWAKRARNQWGLGHNNQCIEALMMVDKVSAEIQNDLIKEA